MFFVTLSWACDRQKILSSHAAESYLKHLYATLQCSINEQVRDSMMTWAMNQVRMLHAFPTSLGPAMSKVLCESMEKEMWQILSLIMKLKRYFSLVTNTEKRKNAEFLIVIIPQTLRLSTVMLFHYDFLTSPSPLPYPSWDPPPPPPLKYHILQTFI